MEKAISDIGQNQVSTVTEEPEVCRRTQGTPPGSVTREDMAVVLGPLSLPCFLLEGPGSKVDQCRTSTGEARQQVFLDFIINPTKFPTCANLEDIFYSHFAIYT